MHTVSPSPRIYTSLCTLQTTSASTEHAMSSPRPFHSTSAASGRTSHGPTKSPHFAQPGSPASAFKTTSGPPKGLGAFVSVILNHDYVPRVQDRTPASRSSLLTATFHPLFPLFMWRR